MKMFERSRDINTSTTHLTIVLANILFNSFAGSSYGSFIHNQQAQVKKDTTFLDSKSNFLNLLFVNLLIASTPLCSSIALPSQQ
jgi:hypothetical protein